LDIVWSRPLPDGVEPSTVTVTMDAAGRWFVSLRVEENVETLPPRTEAVGLELSYPQHRGEDSQSQDV